MAPNDLPVESHDVILISVVQLVSYMECVHHEGFYFVARWYTCFTHECLSGRAIAKL